MAGFGKNQAAVMALPKAMALYSDGWSLPQIAAELGVPASTLRLHMLRAGCELRSRRDGVIQRFSTRDSNPAKGRKRGPVSDETRHRMLEAARRRAVNAIGTSTKPNGYVEYTRGPNKGRSVHVVAIEQCIGRRLAPDEVVHHINGDRSDNRVENLQLMTRSEHARHHLMERKGRKDE